MGKVTDARITALKALFETNDTITEVTLYDFIDGLQEAAQDHQHTATGGSGAGTGDAAPVVNLRSGLDAALPATPDPGDVYLSTDEALVYVCFIDDAWVVIEDQAPAIHGAARHTDVSRHLWIPLTYYPGTHWHPLSGGVFHELPNDAVDTVYGRFRVPNGYVSTPHLYMICAPATSGNIYITATSVFSELGETWYTHSVDGDPELINIPSAGVLTSVEFVGDNLVAAVGNGDYVGFSYTRDATQETDTLEGILYVAGFVFIYTANQ